MNSGPETRLNARKFGFRARTKYGVYSCPSLPFLRIENRAKIKRHIFCSGNLDFGEKTLKEWDTPKRKSRLKPQSDWIKEKDKDNLGHKHELNLKETE